MCCREGTSLTSPHLCILVQRVAWRVVPNALHILKRALDLQVDGYAAHDGDHIVCHGDFGCHSPFDGQLQALPRE